MCVLVSGLVSMQRRHIIHHLISGWREGCLFGNSRTYNRTVILKIYEQFLINQHMNLKSRQNCFIRDATSQLVR